METQQPPITAVDRLWTAQDVAAYTRRSVSWVRARTNDGSLPVVDASVLGRKTTDDADEKPRRSPLYRPESIRALIESIEQPATRPNPYGRRRRGAAA